MPWCCLSLEVRFRWVSSSLRHHENVLVHSLQKMSTTIIDLVPLLWLGFLFNYLYGGGQWWCLGFPMFCRTDIVLIISKARPQNHVPSLRLWWSNRRQKFIRIKAWVRAAQDDDTGSALTNGLSHSQEIWGVWYLWAKVLQFRQLAF